MARSSLESADTVFEARSLFVFSWFGAFSLAAGTGAEGGTGALRGDATPALRCETASSDDHAFGGWREARLGDALGKA